MDELPVTSSGKIQKTKLRERALEILGAGRMTGLPRYREECKE